MTWQGTETAGLAAKGPEQREGWRDPSVLFRDGKSRESSGRRKTREDRHCEASGGAAGFRASRVLRGCVAPRSWGGPRLSIAHQKYGSHTRVANNPDVSARSRFEGKRLPRRALRKGQKRRGLETCKGGVLPGKLTEPVDTLYALEAEGQRGANKKVLRRFGAIKPQTAPRPKGGALLQEPGGRQRLALRRRPLCGGRGCGCRASWPCRRDCR